MTAHRVVTTGEGLFIKRGRLLRAGKGGARKGDQSTFLKAEREPTSQARALRVTLLALRMGLPGPGPSLFLRDREGLPLGTGPGPSEGEIPQIPQIPPRGSELCTWLDANRGANTVSPPRKSREGRFGRDGAG